MPDLLEVDGHNAKLVGSKVPYKKLNWTLAGSQIKNLQRIVTFKVFPDGLMDGFASKIFQAVLCPTQLFHWKLICAFNQHCLSYKISYILVIQFNSSFFWKLFETMLHWHNFFQDVLHIQKTFKYIKTDTYIFYGP